MRRTAVTIALAFAASLAPDALRAQTGREIPPEVRGWVAEMQQLQAQLQPVQAQALQDSAIQQEQQQVSSVLLDAMVDADPQAAEVVSRMQAIMVEARTAQAAGDEDKIAELTIESEALQPRIEEARQLALARPEVQARLTDFREKLEGRMVEIEPQSRPLIDRLHELSDRLRNAQPPR